MSSDIGGVWRTVGGRRIFIKDGQDLETAMKESGKFNNKKTEKIKELEEKLNKTSVSENKVVKKAILEKNGNLYYLEKNESSGNLSLKKQEGKGVTIGNEKAQKKYEETIEKYKSQGFNLKEEKTEKLEEKNIKSYQETQNIKNEINALREGFDNYKEYKEYHDKLENERIQKLKDNYENSFVFKEARNDIDRYNIYYDKEDRNDSMYNPAVFSQVIKKYASKEFDIEEVHASAKSGSKFENSIYLRDKDTGYEIRVSNHYLPQTAEREYNHSLRGTRWDKEIVLDNLTMEEIIKIKNEKDFRKYIRKLFDED